MSFNGRILITKESLKVAQQKKLNEKAQIE